MRSIEIAARFFSSLVLFALVVFGGAVTLALLPSVGDYRAFVVQSGSMEPAIRTGSLIFVRPAETYAVGDVVTRQTETPDVTITHRIVAEERSSGETVYRTKGDANEMVDGETVARGSIIGREALTVPYLGYGVNFAKTPRGFVFIILLPALLIICDELVSIRRSWKKRAYEKQKQKQADPGALEPHLSPATLRNVRKIRII